MSWRIAIRHRTGYKYAEPVRASYNEAPHTELGRFLHAESTPAQAGFRMAG
jgi:hypothetical protein